ncbi:MAG: hypothetical protein L6R28_05975 [Planctomycetes bacterium]|nr:hypothetical protein [Planctomycetota bacterium]
MSDAASPPASTPKPATASEWKADLARALGIVAVACALGLATNALSSKPMPLLDPKGPGALPEPGPRILGIELMEELRTNPQGILMIDARSDELLAEGAPVGAVRMTPETLVEDLRQKKPLFDAARLLVIVCDSDKCPRGDDIAMQLMQFGYATVKVFDGGWPAYKDSGLGIQGPPK